MKLEELIKSGASVTVAVEVNVLKDFADYIINATRRELEAAVISDKAETYPSQKQVSEILGVNLSTLWAWHRKGYLVHFEVGGKRRYRMSQVKALLEGRTK